MRWVLPDHIEDVLPEEALAQETLRRRLLDMFALYGYQLVVPPLLEFADSLLPELGQDLEAKTFRLSDPLSSRALGVRADITPQVARMDAHLLNRKGVARLCYCAGALHTLPASLTATREPLLLGAELYGHAGLEADIEIVRLLAKSLIVANVKASHIDLGHVGIFKALCDEADLGTEFRETLFGFLQSRDIPGLEHILTSCPEIAPAIRKAFMALPELYGDASVLAQARLVLPSSAPILSALDDLERLAASLPDLPLSIDLADLRGYHYHTGVVFAAYAQGFSTALALGGRYDNIGAPYGRARPATGFSMDLKEIVRRLAPLPPPPSAILAPCETDFALQDQVARLRLSGQSVVHALPGHDEASWIEAGCDRRLVLCDGQWVIESLERE
jgi:ATP phosphoribosyltransferase regulatory subunit